MNGGVLCVLCVLLRQLHLSRGAFLRTWPPAFAVGYGGQAGDASGSTSLAAGPPGGTVAKMVAMLRFRTAAALGVWLASGCEIR